MAKFKEYNQHQIMLMPPSLDEKVAEGHLARYISRLVDELDIREIEEGYSGVGCRAYHRRMLIRLRRTALRLQHRYKEFAADTEGNP
jgi:transposase